MWIERLAILLAAALLAALIFAAHWLSGAKEFPRQDKALAAFWFLRWERGPPMTWIGAVFPEQPSARAVSEED